MNRKFLGLLSFLTAMFFTIQSFASIEPINNLLSIHHNLSSGQKRRISSIVREAKIIDANRMVIQQIIEHKKYQIEIQVPMGEEHFLNLILKRYDILTPNASIVAGTSMGDEKVNFSKEFVFYTGQIEGVGSSFVALSFSSLGLYGILSTEQNTYVIGPMDITTTGSEQQHILYSTYDLILENNFYCRTDVFDIPERIRSMMAGLDPKILRSMSADLLEVEMAIESDYETYTRYGSVINTSTYLLSLMSTVSAIYIRDFNIKIVVPYIRVWSTENDPYDGSDSFTLLDQFRSYWNTNMQGIQRDLAHYISTRAGGLGGVAWVDVLCSSISSGLGYAFSNINGSFSSLPAYSWDVDVVSHESGHNFGSPHTHNCFWPEGPIDTCYTPEGGCYNGPPRPIKGTIMSYCHLTSRGKYLRFHPLPVNLIRTNTEQAACASISQTNLSLIIPNGGEVYSTGSKATIIWGAGFPGFVELQFSPDGGAHWESIASSISADNREYEWNIPYIETTTQALIRIQSSLNPSISDTCDNPFTIQTELTEFTTYFPESFTTFEVGPGDPSPIIFGWQKTGGLPGFNYRLHLFDFQYRQAYFNSNNNGQDTTVTLSAHQLDSLITLWNNWNFGDSVRVRWNARAYFAGDSTQSFPIHYLTFKRTITKVSETAQLMLPEKFELKQCFPNPFNPTTTISFLLPSTSNIQLLIYNSLGQRIHTLFNGEKPGGEHQIQWNGKDEYGSFLSSGIYLYHLIVFDSNYERQTKFTQTRKMLLLK
jgi:hypothetical protein